MVVDEDEDVVLETGQEDMATAMPTTRGWVTETRGGRDQEAKVQEQVSKAEPEPQI